MIQGLGFSSGLRAAGNLVVGEILGENLITMGLGFRMLFVAPLRETLAKSLKNGPLNGELNLIKPKHPDGRTSQGGKGPYEGTMLLPLDSPRCLFMPIAGPLPLTHPLRHFGGV